MNPPAGRGARARATRVTRVARLRPAVAARDHGWSAVDASRRTPRAHGGGRGAVSPPRRRQGQLDARCGSRNRSISGQSLTPSPPAPRASTPPRRTRSPSRLPPPRTPPRRSSSPSSKARTPKRCARPPSRDRRPLLASRAEKPPPRLCAKMSNTGTRFFTLEKNRLFRRNATSGPLPVGSRRTPLTFLSLLLLDASTSRSAHRRPPPSPPPSPRSPRPARRSSSR